MITLNGKNYYKMNELRKLIDMGKAHSYNGYAKRAKVNGYSKVYMTEVEAYPASDMRDSDYIVPYWVKQ